MLESWNLVDKKHFRKPIGIFTTETQVRRENPTNINICTSNLKNSDFKAYLQDFFPPDSTF